ncbi:TonB-dependent siderophore receptor [Massilia sp. erpn]|uniref:TonB-dependent receptor plug domain-containing protein n=1 Tax=Massilia sp. erpn TaxID=2738142 RepID=UPI0021069942|nr:TonB-dependent receptor [Massilia sp. erpn]UTY57062.1 TonB-dependent receptor [Massilia sp. erpn]
MMQIKKTIQPVLVALPLVVLGQDVAAQVAQGAGSAAVLPAAPAAQPSEMAVVKIEGVQDLDDRRESTVARLVVTRDDIVRYGSNSVTDVLRHVPGITIGTAAGGQAEIQMRGLGSGYTRILLNGDPVAPGFSVDSLPPNLIERIEVMRGATADLSSQAIAGTINIILKQTVRNAQRELKTSVAGYAGNPSYFLEGQMSDRQGDLSYTLAGGASRENSEILTSLGQIALSEIKAGNSARAISKRESSTIDALNLAPRLNWKLPGGSSVSGDLLLLSRWVDAGTAEARKTLSGTPPLYASDDLTIKARLTILKGKLQWIRKLENAAQLDLKGGFNYSRRSSDARFFEFGESGNVLLDEHTRSLAKDKGWNVSGKYRQPYSSNQTLSAGWEIDQARRAEDRIQRQTAPEGYPALDRDEVFDAKVSQISLYGQNEWEVDASWSVYYGLRWEGLYTKSEGNVFTGISKRSSVFSPVAQTVYKLPGSGKDQVRAGLSRNYKAPSVRDLMPRRYVANDNTPTTPDLQGNPDLRPELAWGLDLAYEHYLGDAGMVSVSVYRRDIDNVILQRLSYSGTAWLTSPVNSGKATTQGLVLEGKVNLSKYAPGGPDLELRANVARNWSKVDAVPGPDNRLEKQTPVSGGIGADFRPASLPLTIGGNFAYQGGRSARTSLTQSAYIGPKRQLDLYALWKFSPKVQVRATALNLLHQNSLASSRYFDANSSFDQWSSTATYRTLRVTLELKL